MVVYPKNKMGKSKRKGEGVMKKKANRLTDLVVRKARPEASSYKLSDGLGLYLLVYPTGNKGWRYRYRFGGKEKMMSLGPYPKVKLSEARNNLEEAKELLAQGIDPVVAKNKKREADNEALNTFELLAREWFTLKYKKEVSAGQAARVMKKLENDIFPWIGSKHISDITAKQILILLRQVEARGALDTAHRCRSICSWVFKYAIASGCAERDPANDLRGILPTPKTQHMAAILDPKEFGEFLRTLHSYEGSIVTRSALKLAPLLFVRPGELRKAEWSEIDLDAFEWNIPGEKMKMKEPHLVPLAKQAVEIFNEIYQVTGGGRFVFPSPRSGDRPMSDNAILAALRRMGYEKHEVSGHGFRATARTLLDEVLKFPPHIIEHQLAHRVRDPLGRAYNRTHHIDERRHMMQVWADYLDGLRNARGKKNG